MTADVLPWIGDGLVLLGLAILTLAVAGLVFRADFPVRLQAAGKGTFLGILPLVAAAALTGTAAATTRGLLVVVFLLLTTPVAAHVLAWAAMHDADDPEPGSDDPAPGEGDHRVA